MHYYDLLMSVLWKHHIKHHSMELGVPVVPQRSEEELHAQYNSFTGNRFGKYDSPSWFSVMLRSAFLVGMVMGAIWLMGECSRVWNFF